MRSRHPVLSSSDRKSVRIVPEFEFDPVTGMEPVGVLRTSRRAIVMSAASLLLMAISACNHPEVSKHTENPAPGERPSILLVTLDTTRADAIGPDAKGIQTPGFNAIAARGRRYLQAYAAVPMTLPSHASMMTGLYPAGHGVHENARYLAASQPVIAEKLHAEGYRTAAFVSAFAVAKRFGLGRGFDEYEENFGEGRAERPAKETTDLALAYLSQPSTQPLFVWVHYYDPHHPYSPPEPYRTKFAKNPYLGEVASMDEQLGRLITAFDRQVKGPKAYIVAGDHGEGLGDHGEAQHGNLMYQSTMHVPLVIAGPGVTPGTSATPVSIRRIFQTILDWSGGDPTNSLRRGDPEVVVGEAMHPFLFYGWQPQVMAIDGRLKSILAGTLEVYDVAADPAETHNLAATASVSRGARAALHDYPIPTIDAAQPAAAMTNEEKQKLASLGYLTSVAKPTVRPGAPRPADMASLFPAMDEAALLFSHGEYAKAAPIFSAILRKDTYNLDAALRLATCYSMLGRDAEAVAGFRRAEEISPKSLDVRTYFGAYYARGKEWPKAVPMLESVVAAEPDRLPALEALAIVRERQGRIDEALKLWQKIFAMRAATAAELSHEGELEMALGQTGPAIEAFEKARAMRGAQFGHDLELGVLYIAAGRMTDARDALDRVPSSHPAYPMALFKRAQVAVLLHEPDAPARIANARQHANPMTRALIANEKLFAGM